MLGGMTRPEPQIAAVVVTYRRDRELGRLLQSIEASTVPLSLVVVVDHAAVPATRQLLGRFHLPVLYIANANNPGPGAGWKNGMETALRELPATTHFLILDDDVVLPPQAVARLVGATESVAVACPMLLDASEKIWAFPEPRESALRRKIREIHTAEESVAAFGHAPLAFVWATGACLLVRREAVDAMGFYRTDFWMLGEDLEYTMRLAAGGGGVFLPDLFVPHLPPPAVHPESAAAAERVKFRSLLQNLAYLSFHHPASGHLRWYLAGNVRRYFRTFGWNPIALGQSFSCLWKGAILRKPAGRK